MFNYWANWRLYTLIFIQRESRKMYLLNWKKKSYSHSCLELSMSQAFSRGRQVVMYLLEVLDY